MNAISQLTTYSDSSRVDLRIVTNTGRVLLEDGFPSRAAALTAELAVRRANPDHLFNREVIAR